MGKLFNLKEWLTVSEAANHLSNICAEEVSEADVLRLALDGLLKLSVEFPNGVPVRLCSPVQAPSDPELLEQYLFEQSVKEIRIVGSEQLGFFEIQNEVVPLGQSNADLAISFGGNTIVEIENRYWSLMGGPKVWENLSFGVFITDKSGDMYEIQCSDDPSFVIRSPESYYHSITLPEDAILIVRTDQIRALEDTFLGEKSVEKPLTTRERNGLLTVIAALCDYSDIKPFEHGAAACISRLTDDIGAPLGAAAIKKYLDDIPQALESKRK